MIIIAEGLLMFYGVEKGNNMERQALDSATRVFSQGLSPLLYGDIPYLPFYTASANVVHLHLFHKADGLVCHQPSFCCAKHMHMLL